MSVSVCGGVRGRKLSPLKEMKKEVKEELCISTRGKMVGGNLGYIFRTSE